MALKQMTLSIRKVCSFQELKMFSDAIRKNAFDKKKYFSKPKMKRIK